MWIINNVDYRAGTVSIGRDDEWIVRLGVIEPDAELYLKSPEWMRDTFAKPYVGFQVKIRW